MEPRNNLAAWKDRQPPAVSLVAYYEHACAMCEEIYPDVLTDYRKRDFENATPDTFWKEYVWCVSVSGFNASVVASFFPRLLEAYGDWRTLWSRDCWLEVSRVNSNLNKFFGIKDTADLLHKSYTALPGAWWPQFKHDYLQTPERMQQLSYIGKITCYHLARNLGLDCIKPDLHLVRLANFFEWKDPVSMCSYLSRLYDERLGVVDLILWYCASSYGTINLHRV